MKAHTLLAATLVAAAACGSADDRKASPDASADSAASAPLSADTGVVVATALASGKAELTPRQIEAGRLDPGWKRYVDIDTPRNPDSSSSDSAGTPPDSAATETWEDISADAVNAPARSLPIHGDVAGPSVARVQILLDLARFSPGVIDGRWGKNTEEAVYWFQKARGLPATGQVDRQTLDALARTAGPRLVVSHTVGAAEVAGPYVDLPDDVYERAAMSCLCYESPGEELGEVFHSTPALLQQLNPGVDLASVAPGTTLNVPAVEPFRVGDLPDGKYEGSGDVARLRVSDGGHYVHALDARGRILYHFPSTLGSDYAPSPSGQFRVEAVTFDPTWHYQPDLLTGVDPGQEDAVLPAGPNNAVGIVWMQLSKPHYGIHGTSAPESIGYATSHGCVRLTNWDAGFLGRRLPPGTPVEFRDVTRPE